MTIIYHPNLYHPSTDSDATVSDHSCSTWPSLNNKQQHSSLVKLQPWFLSLQWKTCIWAELQQWRTVGSKFGEATMWWGIVLNEYIKYKYRTQIIICTAKSLVDLFYLLIYQLITPWECFSYNLYVHIRHTWLACSFTSTETASLFKIVVPCANWFVCRRIFVVLCTKSALNHQNGLTFSKLQHTECLFCTSKHHFSSTAL